MKKLTTGFQLIYHYGIAYCLFRAKYFFQKKCGFLKQRFPVKDWSEIILEEWIKPDLAIAPMDIPRYLQANGRHFFFESNKLPQIDEESGERAISEAEEILHDRFKYFFCKSYSLGKEPDWFLNPATGGRLNSNLHWSEISTFDPNVGDIKYIWELSRFAWVYTLARAFAATGDDKYVEKFWTLFESWIEANRPNMGPNYSCGQECSIRVMAMCFALYAFRNSEASNTERNIKLITAIAVHADRIEKNIDFAISTRTNHSLTEAAGLYTVGILFPEFKHSDRWLKRGKNILVAEGLKQIYKDGSYIQHSMNYHRLMLQDFLWVLRLAELNNDEFCDELMLRVTRATEFLYQMQDDNSGRVPNYGANDGALIIPLNSCDYLDYRPVVQACWYLLKQEKLFGHGPWDEDMLWLFGPSALMVPKTDKSKNSCEFRSGGYYTLRGNRSWGMIRCHSYQARVGHIDMLHFDLWADGINLLRDCGTYKYYAPDEPEYENYFKSIRSHNTVTVDDTLPLELVSKFTWLPWPKAELLSCISKDTRIHWEGRHFAYNRSPWNIIHSRSVTVENDRWVIIDTLKGKNHHILELRWHLPSKIKQLSQDNKSIKLRLPKDWIMEVSSQTELAFRKFKAQNEGGWESCYYGAKSPICTISAAKDCQLPMEFKTIVYKKT